MKKDYMTVAELETLDMLINQHERTLAGLREAQAAFAARNNETGIAALRSIGKARFFGFTKGGKND